MSIYPTKVKRGSLRKEEDDRYQIEYVVHHVRRKEIEGRRVVTVVTVKEVYIRKFLGFLNSKSIKCKCGERVRLIYSGKEHNKKLRGTCRKCGIAWRYGRTAIYHDNRLYGTRHKRHGVHDFLKKFPEGAST